MPLPTCSSLRAGSMSFVGMDTFEAFEAYLEVLPEGTDWASVAAGVMEAKATVRVCR